MTKAGDQRPTTANQWKWLFFGAMIVFVYLFALGSLPLVGPDEPRYAQVAREMFERGDWLTPTLGGTHWFEKPVLLYWLQIISYKIFGVSEFAARFGPALFGLGTIFTLWILGKLVTAKESTRNFANWLALIAASSIGLIAFSRGASFDIILTFPITASLVGFFIFDQSEKRSGVTLHVSLFAFYFFIGIALLAKGLVGILLPFAVVAFYYLLSRKFPNKAFIFSLVWGTILSLLVASVWYLPMYNAHGWTFIDEFFIQHHFARYTSNKYQHPQPFYFFFWVLPLMTIPWLPFFLASIAKFLANRFHIIRYAPETVLGENSSLARFALAWLLVPLVFFSFSGSKLPGYILPALPAAAILTAEYMYGLMQRSAKWKTRVQIVAFLTFAVVSAILQFAAPKYAEADSDRILIETANAKGYAAEKITNLFVVSHNAEFYAAGRLVRNTDGKLKRYDNFFILVEDLKRQKPARILVLVPSFTTASITESSLVDSEILADNGDTSIVLVRPKEIP